MATVIENGRSGFVDTNIEVLIEHMQELIRDPALAHELGEQGRRNAMERFNIQRFVRDWTAVLAEVTATAMQPVALSKRAVSGKAYPFFSDVI